MQRRRKLQKIPAPSPVLPADGCGGRKDPQKTQLLLPSSSADFLEYPFPHFLVSWAGKSLNIACRAPPVRESKTRSSVFPLHFVYPSSCHLNSISVFLPRVILHPGAPTLPWFGKFIIMWYLCDFPRKPSPPPCLLSPLTIRKVNFSLPLRCLLSPNPSYPQRYRHKSRRWALVR